MTEPAGREAGTVHSTLAQGVATVRFGHPKGNSLPGALLTQIAASIREAGGESEARVIVLESEGGGAFCGGASFDEFQAIQDAEQGRRFFSGFAEVILAMIRAPKFVVARVQGKAAGGGVGLIAAADYALASTDAAVKLSELALGIGPFVVGPVIEKRIGLGAFAALAVEADWHSAAWGERHGLFAEVLDTPPALDARVRELTRKLAGYHPEAMRELKQTFWAGTEQWSELLPERAATSGRLVLSDYTRKAIGGRA